MENKNTNPNPPTTTTPTTPATPTKNSFVPLIAGICGGAVSTALLLPLEIIKVRLQVTEELKAAAATSKNVANSDGYHSNNKVPPKSYSHRLGSIRVVRGILRHEGIAGFYQGLQPALLGSAISWGGYFFLYEGFKERLKVQRSHLPPENRTITSSDNFFMACSAGMVMVFVTNPIWLIKLRMQLQMKRASEKLGGKVKPYNSILDAGRTIVREEGLWALYKGTGPALLLTSHGGVQFVVYEFLRKKFHMVMSQRGNRDTTQPILKRLEHSLGYLLMGAVAKIVASTTTYPLQVLKSRMQQRSKLVELTAEGDVRVVEREYAGMIGTVKKMWSQEGISAFFRGCIPNAIRVAPSSAITFVVYEAVRDLLEP